MKRKVLLILLAFIFSCKPGKILFEENILKMDLSTRMGTVPLNVEVYCEISPSIQDVPCLDEEWFCWPAESISSTNDYLNKIFVENDCKSGVKRKFSMDFTLDSPGRYTIELVLREKSGKVFARVTSYPILAKTI
jgi:hypothetical protein